MIRKEDK